jgi:predicted Rossmann fold nucleotide-binding protein DprA/Smf involved in DNA uptake
MASLPTYQLSPDTQATLLLCSGLGQPRDATPRPLTPAEYNQLAQALHAQALRPADLLQPGGLDHLQQVAPVVDLERLKALLGRGAALGLAVETWTSKGLWVIGRSDDLYPARLKARLKRNAPAILYGVGEAELLKAGGLVIVGSREADAAGRAFAETIARRCALEGTTVISGGARGIDAAAMSAALERGGRAIGVLADSLARAALAKGYREWLRQGRVVLCSPYDPGAGFTVDNAMGRNRHIYALGDAALVVSASAGSGGTWAGALENLKHRWIPLHVRAGSDAPAGNQRLIERGGQPIYEPALPPAERLIDWLARWPDGDEPVPPGVAGDPENNAAPAGAPARSVAHVRPAEQLPLPLLAGAESRPE